METPRIPFPTCKDSLRPGRADVLGYPDRAKPCRGHACVVHDGECIWCGHLPVMAILRTWADRARRVGLVE